MKVKEMIELLKRMNQESEIYVAGGFTEYATTDVEVIEQYERVSIQEK